MSVTILQGDALTMLATLPSESVQVVCTSPPYLNLRSYLPDDHPDKVKEIGLHDDPSEFVDALVTVFSEVKRVLHRSGTLWLNLGFSYAGSGKGPTGHNGIGDQGQRQGFADRMTRPAGFKPKDLMLMPFFMAEALRQDGWYLRSVICWAKKSAMPESVVDRPTSAWEPIFLFSRSRTYYYDAEAVRQPASPTAHAMKANGAAGRSIGPKATDHGLGIKTNASFHAAISETLPEANLRNFWLLGPEPSREEHYAAFPTEIPKRCILAGSSAKGQCPACGAPWVRVVERERGDVDGIGRPKSGPGGYGTPTSTLSLSSNGSKEWAERGAKVRTVDWQPSCSCDAGEPVPQTVLDPFLGSGTTALVADRLDRHAIGVELNEEYCAISRRRIEQDAGFLADVTTVAGPVHVQSPLLPALDRPDDGSRRAG